MDMLDLRPNPLGPFTSFFRRPGLWASSSADREECGLKAKYELEKAAPQQICKQRAAQVGQGVRYEFVVDVKFDSAGSLQTSRQQS